MKPLTTTDAETLKTVSANHKKHTITLKTSGEPYAEQRGVFKAELTNKELEKLCDFITSTFNKEDR